MSYCCLRANIDTISLIYVVGIKTLKFKLYHLSEVKMENNELLDTKFNSFQPRFMCCCGSTHVKKGAKIIGIIHLILSIVSILNYLISPTAFGGKIAVLILSSLTIVPIITLLIGVKKENHRYLIPYLILEV